MTVRSLPPGSRFKTEFGVEYILESCSPCAARVLALGTKHVQIKRDDGSVTEFDRPAGSFSISPGTEVEVIA